MTDKEDQDAAARSKSKKRRGNEKAEAVQTEATNTWTTGTGCSGSSSKVSPQTQSDGKLDKTVFIVIQKNMRSMNSSDGIDELFRVLQQVEWDAILISETWRQSKEIWETQQGHMMIESGKFINKHGVAILLNRRWKNKINWVQRACERVVAMSSAVNNQPITLMSVYMPLSGYPDHHVEKNYKTILTTILKDKSMKIIGGDFNDELGPGEGIELSSVGYYTLNKANGRGEWMTQWLLENSFVALNTMYKKVPQKQVTYHTPKNVEKQLDYILTDRKHYPWSRDAEANDTIHMGSDHRCVMAKFEIPKDQGKPRHNKAPKCESERKTYDDDNEQKNGDLEQEVKEAEPGTSKESMTKEAADAKVMPLEQKSEAKIDVAPAASAASPSSAAAADGQPIRGACAAAIEGTAASEAQETTVRDEKIRALIQERKTTAKHEKGRIRDISKEIKKWIRQNKRTKRQVKIQKILEKIKGTKNIPSIKSMKKRILIPKVKNKDGETIKTRQGIANVFAKFFEDLYEGEGEFIEKEME